jgi:hypothetical protein
MTCNDVQRSRTVAERDSHQSNEPPTPDVLDSRDGPIAPDLEGMTYKQFAFAEAYIGEAHGNGVAAARIAGYTGSPNTLAQQAYRLLAHHKVRSHICTRVEQIVGDSTAILQQLWEVASAPTAHFMVVTREEQYDADGNRVKEMQIRQDYSAKVRALELLMKYHGMLANKPPAEVTVKALIGVDLNRV